MYNLQSFKRMSELPFSSDVKFMVVSGTHPTEVDTREKCYMKGALDTVLARCASYYVSEESVPLRLDSSIRKRILEKAKHAAQRGLRVVGLAYGFGGVKTVESAASEPNLVFVGYEAMQDPPREGVADAIGLLQRGGVHVVMITGDAEDTALSIAHTLGLRVQSSHAGLGSGFGGDEDTRAMTGVMTGSAIDELSPSQLADRVGSVSVFARATPRHKVAIVEAYRARGSVVAMTGDGGEFRSAREIELN